MVILSWIGTEPNLPTICLNSHIDVVPVESNMWKYDPFSAHIDENGFFFTFFFFRLFFFVFFIFNFFFFLTKIKIGDIFARGAQDMKSVGISYLMAIYRLKQQGFLPRRTIHVSFVKENFRYGFIFFKHLNLNYILIYY